MSRENHDNEGALLTLAEPKSMMIHKCRYIRHSSCKYARRKEDIRYLYGDSNPYYF